MCLQGSEESLQNIVVPVEFGQTYLLLGSISEISNLNTSQHYIS